MPARRQRTTDEARARLEGDACAGCLTSFAKKGYLGGRGPSIFVGNGKKVYVCYGRGQQPSDRCTLLARERESACPGCGSKPCDVGTICEECKKSLARGKSVEARQLEWWGVASDALGPFLSEWDHESHQSVDHMDALAELICKAIATGRTVSKRDPEAPRGAGWSHELSEVVAIVPSKRKNVDYGRSEIFYVELVKGQGEALEALVEKIREVIRLQWKNGFEKGNSILRRLASGERGILESEKDLEHAREHHDRQDERVRPRDMGRPTREEMDED